RRKGRFCGKRRRQNASGLWHMSEWKVVYTEQAERDLHSIFEYIEFSLLEPEIAKNQSRALRNQS
ncbi:MAG: hypothetical protein PHU78_09655, partial [Heliobacteriaceae bacterium]|nr:hypothetical protein [Heliobacteriaceae bacterium]